MIIPGAFNWRKTSGADAAVSITASSFREQNKTYRITHRACCGGGVFIALSQICRKFEINIAKYWHKGHIGMSPGKFRLHVESILRIPQEPASLDSWSVLLKNGYKRRTLSRSHFGDKQTNKRIF